MTSRSIRRAAERREAKEAGRARRRAIGTALGAGAALGATVVYAPPAQAGTYQVTNSNNIGAGSLRAAINAANGVAGPDTITFAPSVTGTILLGSGLSIVDDVTIAGPGSDVLAIDGQDLRSIFNITGSVAATTISGLTLTNGYATLNPEDSLYGQGGAIYDTSGDLTLTDLVVTSSRAYYNGGAVHVEGPGADVVITRSSFTGNDAVDGGALSIVGAASVTIDDSTISGNTSQEQGAGIYLAHAGDLTIADSEVSGNAADRAGGGMYVVDVAATSITGSSIADNSAGGGGGIYFNDGDTFLLADSIVSGNHAYSGGGIALYDFNVGVPAEFRDSSIVDNVSVGAGGGLNVGGDEGGGAEVDFSVDFTNTTVSGNEARFGGGVYLYGDVSPGNAVVFNHSTVANNTGSIATGGILAQGGVKALRGTVVADNVGGDLALSNGATEPFSLDFSLVEDPGPAGTTTAVTAGSNLVGVDPQLGALGTNGGPTPTQVPARTSPAIDQSPAFGLTTDQRGLVRPSDFADVANAAGSNGSDVGAVELAAPVSPAATPPLAAPSGLSCHGKTATIVAVAGVPTAGTPGADVIVGTEGADVITAGDGDDLVCAAGGDDDVDAGSGRDKVLGGPGADTVTGGSGRDKVRGNAGKDRLGGGRGQDKLTGGKGTDRLGGGKDDDRLVGSSGDDRIYGRPGDDLLVGGAGTDVLRGGRGRDVEVPGSAKPAAG